MHFGRIMQGPRLENSPQNHPGPAKKKSSQESILQPFRELTTAKKTKKLHQSTSLVVLTVVVIGILVNKTTEFLQDYQI
jgi:hypothetical protein